MHGLAVCIKEGLSFARDLSLENSREFLSMLSTGFTSFDVLLLFPMFIIVFVFVHGFSCYFI